MRHSFHGIYVPVYINVRLISAKRTRSNYKWLIFRSSVHGEHILYTIPRNQIVPIICSRISLRPSPVAILMMHCSGREQVKLFMQPRAKNVKKNYNRKIEKDLTPRHTVRYFLLHFRDNIVSSRVQYYLVQKSKPKTVARG